MRIRTALNAQIDTHPELALLQHDAIRDDEQLFEAINDALAAFVVSREASDLGDWADLGLAALFLDRCGQLEQLGGIRVVELVGELVTEGEDERAIVSTLTAFWSWLGREYAQPNAGVIVTALLNYGVPVVAKGPRRGLAVAPSA